MNEYVNIIIKWLLEHCEGDAHKAYEWWQDAGHEKIHVLHGVLDDYQLGQSSAWSEEKFNDAASFFDQNIETLLGLREKSDEQ